VSAARDIAAALGVSREALGHRLREWGVTPAIRHGAVDGWQYRKCPCAECQVARTEYKRASRQRRPAKPVTAPDGTMTSA
jgi:Zn-dependent peptidase ImmA (M78 family)